MLLILIVSLLMCAVLYYDITRYLIPNWIVGLLLLIYPLALLLLPPGAVDWQSAALLALGAFMAGFVIYVLKLMGGGDVKLLTVCILWVGPKQLFDYIALVAVAGGVLALALWLGRMALAKYQRWMLKELKLPRMLQTGAPVPYGIPIALVFLYRLWTNQVEALPVLIGGAI